ncbi:MAG: aminopeptidase N [Pseudomonadota bacterium]
MRTEQNQPVRLADYSAPAYLIDHVDLDFKLHPTATKVLATLRLRRNPAADNGTVPLVLDGDGLELGFIGINSATETLHADAYSATPDSLTIHTPPQTPFALHTEVEINPSENTQLMGLYLSNGIYTTQCEPEGFRRITYFLDRPDVLATYHVRVEADRASAPILLANGNPGEAGDSGPDRHFAVWDDPHPKPSYLFALVAGDLGVVSDSFTTLSGRPVALNIYVERGKEPKASYAMDALKRSMTWDEQAFGREYDLDVFNIVAVSHFNMGAMENKGLNIFNDKYVLASPETATDDDYEGIEAVIAHEYFHNWTGNRITCREWFQLCLKEGLTVFRDQEFTADMRSRPVKRIQDVRRLRTHQFSEDSGPLAHPVRPDIYHEINNFYTMTVYEKGAELVRMIKTIVGDDAFGNGMDLYFERHDGDAATVEDFLACFDAVTERDLQPFMDWYDQAGTPELTVASEFDATTGTVTLTLSQRTKPTPGQTDKKPLPLPVKLALFDRQSGKRISIQSNGERHEGDFTVIMTGESETVSFDGVAAPPVISLLRDFSAPVTLRSDLGRGEQLLLAGQDDNAFNRWQAAHGLVLSDIVGAYGAMKRGADVDFDDALLEALLSGATDDEFDPAFRAELITPPGYGAVAPEIGTDIDPAIVQASIDGFRQVMADSQHEALAALVRALPPASQYRPDADQAGQRSLRNAALSILAANRHSEALTLVHDQLAKANNMTDRLAALAIMNRYDATGRKDALDAFYDRFQDDPLVVQKWFALQVSVPAEQTLDVARSLIEHPAFSMENPNKVRSVIGVFAAGNPVAFNRADGEGYRFVADQVIALDELNPQVAARLLTAFRSWRTIEQERREKAEAALQDIARTAQSSDVRDIVSRTLESM